MTRIVVHQERIGDVAAAMKLCPFGAIEAELPAPGAGADAPGTDALGAAAPESAPAAAPDSAAAAAPALRVNAACRFCGICVKKGPPGAFELIEDQVPAPSVDKSLYRGIAVYVEFDEGQVHPVSLELIGKARLLAAKIGHPVIALLAGSGVAAAAEELRHYGVAEVRLYDYPALEHFRIEPYAAVFEDFIRAVMPSVVLVGGTPVGRSLAPRLAARFRTGLTADCTSLDIRQDTDLDQIRPAFGGNIMAHILTSRTRPQFATVRCKIFDAPVRSETPSGRIVSCRMPKGGLESAIRVLSTARKERVAGLEDAEVIVVAGRGVKKREDLAMLEELAELLGGQIAGTRPLIEAGWVDPRKQIGLSGRTVKPKLLLAFGVSGSVQFVAGMGGSETVIAVNLDPAAPILCVSHYAVIGDLYEIVPGLIGYIRSGTKERTEVNA